MISESINKYLTTYPPQIGDIKYVYGTAGFRMKHDLLDYVNFTVGILANLRSKYLGQAVGVMVTASHNPPDDNGVKIVDPLGNMLESSWEEYATFLANSPPKDLVGNVEKLIEELNININQNSTIILGRDSRASSKRLSDRTLEGIKSISNVRYLDHGLLTTPQLHYLVRAENDHQYGDTSEVGYYYKMAAAYKKMAQDCDNEIVALTIDAANGVGGPKAKELFTKYLTKEFTIDFINDSYETPSLLNFECGADFVKTNQKFPKGINNDCDLNTLFASFDGDADRLICYYRNTSGFQLLDGDKMATLIALYFENIFKAVDINLNVGLVQTAYANGSSTKYVQEVLKLPVVCAKTGVKHLHHEAEKFDIGIYFEANGHGTVTFTEKAQETIFAYTTTDNEEKTAIKSLQNFTKLINQVVGDAISDLLVIVIILKYLKFSPEDWNSLYTDLPNRLIKVIVPDRTVYKTTNAERTLVEPPELQTKIDQLVQKYAYGRSFVRASGTEDAVRVYAEAETDADVEKLINQVKALIV